MNAMLHEPHVRVSESYPQALLELDAEYPGRAVVLLRVRGEAACDQAARLAELLCSSLRPGSQFVILDLAGLTLAGPAAVAALADFSRDLSRQGGEVWLANLQPAFWLALHAAGLERLFTIRPSVAEALGS
jgi:anti-anti-sigma factor